MNQELNSLNKANNELKRALGHFVNSLPSSGPLGGQVQSIADTLHANDAIYTFASLVEQYTKMQQSINELEREDLERDIAAFKLLISQSANKNILPIQKEKLTAILAKINLEQSTHTLMIAAGKALVYLADELSQLKESKEGSKVVASIKYIATEDTELVTGDVFSTSKRLIKEVVTISRQLIQMYPNDTFIRNLLYEASHQIPDNQGSFSKAIDLLAGTAEYLALLLQQERCWAEEILNDIHTNLIRALKETAIIDKLMASAKSHTNQVQLAMVSELESMEVKAKRINTIKGMQ